MSPAADVRMQADTLAKSTKSSLDLLSQFISTLESDSSSPPTTSQHNDFDVFDVLCTSATLLKAHTTKLSLLIINKPFSPTALQSVLKDVFESCVPAMMAGVEACQSERYGRTVYHEVKLRVRSVLRELSSLLTEILGLANPLLTETDTSEDQTTKNSLASTGVVWEACDVLIDMKRHGHIGVLVAKAQSYREMLEDAIFELKDWIQNEVHDDDEERDGQKPGEEDHDTEHSENDDDADANDMQNIEQIFEVECRLPHSRPDLKETAEQTLKKLRLNSTLCQAVIKRRIKTFNNAGYLSADSSVPQVSRLDSMLDNFKFISEEADELASALYELDNNIALGHLEHICTLGEGIVSLGRIGWENKEDEFTKWSGKWLEALRTQ